MMFQARQRKPKARSPARLIKIPVQQIFIRIEIIFLFIQKTIVIFKDTLHAVKTLFACKYLTQYFLNESTAGKHIESCNLF